MQPEIIVILITIAGNRQIVNTLYIIWMHIKFHINEMERKLVLCLYNFNVANALKCVKQYNMWEMI